MAQRARRFTGEAGDALVHGQAEQGGAHVHRQQRAGQRRSARVAVGGQRQRHAGRTQRGDRRQGGIAGEIEGTGQQHGDGAGGGHRGDAGIVQMFDMVGRQCTEAGRQFGAMLVAQLLGVDLHRQPVGARRFEDLPRLRRREGDVLAEHVHRFGQAFGGDGRNHHVAHLVGVFLRLAAWRNRVCAEEGGHHVDPAFLAQRARHLQLLAFVGQGQAVAGLDLDRGHAFGTHRQQARPAFAGQLFRGGSTGGAHGGDDAAAGTGDLGIADALQALLEFVGAVAGVDQVGVAVDQAGRDPAAFAVDAGGRLQVGIAAGRADVDDAAVGAGQDAIADDTQPFAIEGDQVDVGPEGIDVHGIHNAAVLICLYNIGVHFGLSSHVRFAFPAQFPCRPRPAGRRLGPRCPPAGAGRPHRGDQHGAGRPAGDTRVGILVPGLPNLHSHAFQRGMAGLTEIGGGDGDSFWSWRELMYRFLAHLRPDAVQAIAAQAYMEMLESGFTRVGEFHYLHHDADGRAYANRAEMSARIAAAADQTGIGLTLLPVFYAHADFGGAAPNPAQRRLIHDVDGFAQLLEAAKPALAALPDAVLGIAPHSLRAVTGEELSALLPLTDGPVHIHIAEQVREVEACLAWSGQRPVQWLYDHAPVDARWCLVHATHITDDERAPSWPARPWPACARSPRPTWATACSRCRRSRARAGASASAPIPMC
jgi:hypothetical protein